MKFLHSKYWEIEGLKSVSVQPKTKPQRESQSFAFYASIGREICKQYIASTELITIFD